MQKTAIFVINYNMPERTNHICGYIDIFVKRPHDLYVIDNGSDLTVPSVFTNVWLEKNRQTVGGWLAGVDAAVESGEDYFAYWFIITSMQFDLSNWDDPLDHLLPVLEYPDTFAVHPATTFNHSPWTQWMSPKKEKSNMRRVWGTDYISVLINAEKYHLLGGFRPELTMGWGMIGEMNWKARKHGWKIYINDQYVIHKETDIGYSMDRMNMTAKERRELASKQSDDILVPIYGKDYREKFRYEYTELGADGDY